MHRAIMCFMVTDKNTVVRHKAVFSILLFVILNKLQNCFFIIKGKPDYLCLKNTFRMK